MNDPIRRGLDDGDVSDVCSNCGEASFNDGEASRTARLVVCSDSNVLRRGWEEDSDRSTALQALQIPDIRFSGCKCMIRSDFWICMIRSDWTESHEIKLDFSFEYDVNPIFLN
ncbi:hypothetical protein AB3S75_024343 [Citrus x aurantiifolia]